MQTGGDRGDKYTKEGVKSHKYTDNGVEGD